MRRYLSALQGFRWSICGMVFCLLLALAGCEERYRYPCQDPKNWSNDECRRPQCAVTGTCPDQLNRPNDMKSEREP
jgi:hypothetical protein